MRVLGIDPGVNGGAAIVEHTAPHALPRLVAAIDLPTTGESAKRRVDPLALQAWLNPYAPSAGFIERAQALPKQGSSSGFLYGRAVGTLETVIQLSGLRLEVIEPRAWKQRFNLGGGDASKEDGRQKIIRMYPDAAQAFSLKKHHQRSDAALIATYGCEVLFRLGVKQ